MCVCVCVCVPSRLQKKMQTGPGNAELLSSILSSVARSGCGTAPPTIVPFGALPQDAGNRQRERGNETKAHSRVDGGGSSGGGRGVGEVEGEEEEEEKDAEDMEEGERNEVLFKHACEFGRDVVALLMIKKKEVQVTACRNDALYLPLHVACRYGRQAVVSALLHSGADPNARTSTGKTPLHFAVVSLHAGVVETLLKAGANSRLKDDAQLYASQMATVDTPDNRARWLANSTLRAETFAVLDMLPLLQRGLVPEFMRAYFVERGGADYFELDDDAPLDEYGLPYSDDEEERGDRDVDDKEKKGE